MAFAVTPFERNLIIESLTKEEVKIAFKKLDEKSPNSMIEVTQLA